MNPELWGLLDYLLKYRLLKRLNVAPLKSSQTGGLEYSKTQFRKYGYGQNSVRPLTLTRLLASLPGIDKSGVLCIGPRFSSELFWAESFGFRHKGILGLDTFSYSSRIIVGDMHELPFANETIQNVILGWTLSYSTEPELVLREIQRVVKKGGFIAIGVAYYHTLSEEQYVSGTLPLEKRVQRLSQIDESLPACSRVFGIEAFPAWPGGCETIAIYVKNV